MRTQDHIFPKGGVHDVDGAPSGDVRGASSGGAHGAPSGDVHVHLFHFHHEALPYDQDPDHAQPQDAHSANLDEDGEHLQLQAWQQHALQPLF